MIPYRTYQHVDRAGRGMGATRRLGVMVSCTCWLLASAAWIALPPTVAPAAAQSTRQQELRRLQENIEQARDTRERLRREQQALRAEAERIRADLVRMATQAQALEQDLSRTERRIASLQEQHDRLLARLRANRATTTQLLAALQRLRRDPPPPFVTRPDDVLAAVRGALAMGAVLPGMERHARRLRSDLERLASLRDRLHSERESRRRNLDRLRDTASRLQGMLKLKQDLLERTGERLQAQEARLKRLLKQAGTLSELLAALQREQRDMAQRRRQAAEEERKRRKSAREGEEKEKLAPERPVFSRAFDSLRGRLPWPAQGQRLAGFGQHSRLLGKLAGIYIATRRGAVVTAPADAKVLLAGAFRGYGKLVILDAGREHRILLAGLRDVTVRTGETVRAGEPVGRMGERPAPSTITDESIAVTRPILYMELRKGKKLLDPSAWLIGGRRQARRN